jgi:hypothetical protein
MRYLYSKPDIAKTRTQVVPEFPSLILDNILAVIIALIIANYSSVCKMTYQKNFYLNKKTI